MKTFIISVALVAVMFTGRIYDKDTKEFLAGVKFTTSQDTIYSDLDGNFNIKMYPNDTLHVEYISYKDTTLIIKDFNGLIGLSQIK